MFPPSHILLPTDFSQSAVAVARYASALAGRFRSRITLLHALPPVGATWGVEGYSVLVDEVLARQRSQTRRQLDRFLEDEFREVDVDRVLVDGVPSEAIVEHAHANRVDLIMMPTRGCGPFRRFILGSVTAKVLHDADCPVWTSAHIEEARHDRSALPGVILCAVDLLPEAEAILLCASELAAQLDARLVVVHAIPSLEFHPETYYLEADMRRSMIGEAHAKIAKILRGSPTPEAVIRVECGAIPRVLRFTAEDSRADLLIIGRATTKGMLGRLRTHSYAILRDASCPVISI